MSLGRLGASGGSRTGIRIDIALLPCSAWLQSRMLKSVMILLGVSVNVATLEGIHYKSLFSAKTIAGSQEQNLSPIEEELRLGS